jgi:hypothetical protein
VPGPVGGYQRFGGTYNLHLQGTSILKIEYKTTRRHNVQDENPHVSASSDYHALRLLFICGAFLLEIMENEIAKILMTLQT